jgi:hypothetical protein
MADWTTLPDSSLEPGKPMRSIDGLALRDNPIAIAEGAAGAPKVLAAGLATGDNERDWVLARTAGAAVGAVGTYAWLGETSAVTTAPGGTRAGSSLRYVGITSDKPWTSPSNNLSAPSHSNTPSGTWRCMGDALSTGADRFPATLWLRIS